MRLIFNTINHLLYDIRALLLTWLAYLFFYVIFLLLWSSPLLNSLPTKTKVELFFILFLFFFANSMSHLRQCTTLPLKILFPTMPSFIYFCSSNTLITPFFFFQPSFTRKTKMLLTLNNDFRYSKRVLFYPIHAYLFEQVVFLATSFNHSPSL